MQKTIVISDIHGCFYTMIRLLNRCPKSSCLFFAGDLIDRGPHSRQVVEFAMNNNIPTTIGNHEDMCIGNYDQTASHVRYPYSSWLNNGGLSTIRNWPIIDKRLKNWEEDAKVGGRVPNSVLLWMRSLPAYILIKEHNKDGKKLLISHTGFGLDVDRNPLGGWNKALWTRYAHDTDAFIRDSNGESTDDGLYRVFGHTQNDQPIVTSTFANIDTGAAYGNGKLSAFIWPDCVTIIESTNETPINVKFNIKNGCII